MLTQRRNSPGQKFQHPRTNKPPVICILSLLFSLFIYQNVSGTSQDLPKVPAVIAQSEFDYYGTHFVVQLTPSSDAVIRKVDFPGGGVNEGDFVLTCGMPKILLRSGSTVLSEIAPILDARFVQHDSDSSWVAYGTSPIILLTQKDKLPLIVLAQYGSSNGSDFLIYLIQQEGEKFKIKPVEFGDRWCGDAHQTVLFGSNIQNFYDETKKVDYLRLDGYDNSIGDWFTIYYLADYRNDTLWKLVEYRTGSAPTECFEAEG